MQLASKVYLVTANGKCRAKTSIALIYLPFILLNFGSIFL